MFQFYITFFVFVSLVAGYRPNNLQFRRLVLLLILGWCSDCVLMKVFFSGADLFNLFVLGIPAFTVLFRLEPVVEPIHCGTVFLFLAFEAHMVSIPAGTWSLSSLVWNRLMHSLNGNIAGYIKFTLIFAVCFFVLRVPLGFVETRSGGKIPLLSILNWSSTRVVNRLGPFVKPWGVFKPLSVILVTIGYLICLPFDTVYTVLVICWYRGVPMPKSNNDKDLVDLARADRSAAPPVPPRSPVRLVTPLVQVRNTDLQVPQEHEEED